MRRGQAGFLVRSNRLSSPGPVLEEPPVPEGQGTGRQRGWGLWRSFAGSSTSQRTWEERRLVGDGSEGLNLEGSVGAGRCKRSGRGKTWTGIQIRDTDGDEPNSSSTSWVCPASQASFWELHMHYVINSWTKSKSRRDRPSAILILQRGSKNRIVNGFPEGLRAGE